MSRLLGLQSGFARHLRSDMRKTSYVSGWEQPGEGVLFGAQHLQREVPCLLRACRRTTTPDPPPGDHGGSRTDMAYLIGPRRDRTSAGFLFVMSIMSCVLRIVQRVRWAVQRVRWAARAVRHA